MESSRRQGPHRRAPLEQYGRGARRQQTHNNLGSALAETGRFDEAMAQIQKAIELDADNGAAHINLGHLLEVTGHRQEAIEQLTQGIQIAPRNADGHNVYGAILAREGKMDEAIAELQQAVTLAPGSAECHYTLGRAYAATNRFPEALPQFEAAAKLTGSREPAILQMLAAMYSETGDFSRAVIIAQQALDLAEKQQNTELATALRANLARFQLQAQAGPAAQK
jgi:tetratricopeptide (TPR) repeat protein